MPPGTLPGFLAKAIAYVGADCLLWPHSLSLGYGVIMHNGKLEKVNRMVCEAVHGPPPPGRHDAAHNCGNRACANPQHLRWDTRSGNLADRALHGTDQVGERNPAAKLTKADVQKIRNQPHRLERELAAEFGVRRQQINKIRRGERWGWLPRA